MPLLTTQLFTPPRRSRDSVVGRSRLTDRLAATNSQRMANALRLAAPDRQFATFDRPFGLWIGAEDELFLPDKI